MKTMKSEIKENLERTNSDRKKTGIQINSLDQREEINGFFEGTQINNLEQEEEINIHPEKNEETRIQKKKKNEERLRNLQDNFKCSNIWIIGVPEGEEEEQEIENLLEIIMK